MDRRKKIWVFGDSFSTPFSTNKDPWSLRYCEWKGYKPKYFGELMGEELDMDNESFGMGGSCNDTIFEKICLNVNNFKDGDVVIIGWSDSPRFRLVIEDKWMNFVPDMVSINHKDYQSNFISKRTLEETIINREHILYLKQLLILSSFIKTTLNNMGVKCIFWTPFYMWKDYEHKSKAALDIIPNDWFIGFNVNNISMETKRVIDDGHYSERGHVELADVFCSKLKPKII